MTSNNRTYPMDNAFKAWARAHQLDYREQKLHDFNTDRLPQVLLKGDNARKGLIFCETYRELIRKRVGIFGTSAVYSNMLRSEHIPYNFFVPLEEDKTGAAELIAELVGTPVMKVLNIHIEFAGYGPAEEYLNDGTSFDALIEYVDMEERKCALGIEVKYTETSYPIGGKEKKDILDTGSRYHTMTKESGYYTAKVDVTDFAQAHSIRQMWRNHLLAYAMTARKDYEVIHYVHVYPERNSHFHTGAVPEYLRILRKKGKESFIPLTYENYFTLLERHFNGSGKREWLVYLRERYLGHKVEYRENLTKS